MYLQSNLNSSSILEPTPIFTINTNLISLSLSDGFLIYHDNSVDEIWENKLKD